MSAAGQLVRYCFRHYCFRQASAAPATYLGQRHRRPCAMPSCRPRGPADRGHGRRSQPDAAGNNWPTAYQPSALVCLWSCVGLRSFLPHCVRAATAGACPPLPPAFAPSLCLAEQIEPLSNLDERITALIDGTVDAVINSEQAAQLGTWRAAAGVTAPGWSGR